MGRRDLIRSCDLRRAFKKICDKKDGLLREIFSRREIRSSIELRGVTRSDGRRVRQGEGCRRRQARFGSFNPGIPKLFGFMPPLDISKVLTSFPVIFSKINTKIMFEIYGKKFNN